MVRSLRMHFYPSSPSQFSNIIHCKNGCHRHIMRTVDYYSKSKITETKEHRHNQYAHSNLHHKSTTKGNVYTHGGESFIYCLEIRLVTKVSSDYQGAVIVVSTIVKELFYVSLSF